MKSPRRTGVLVCSVALFVVALQARAQTIVSCPLNGGGDQITRGFYIQNYPGSTLGTVQLTYYPNGAGAYTVSLTARAGAFNGAQIGSTQMATFTPAGGGTAITYDFGNAAVTPGSTVTFTQVIVAGPSVLFYDTGPCGLGAACSSCPGVVETEDTAPPLSVFRRGSVGLTITGTGAGAGPVVPTLGVWGLVVLAAALAGAGLLAIRR